MIGWRSVLAAADIEQAAFQVDLVPSHLDQFRDSKPVTVSQHDEHAVPESIAADAHGRNPESLDFLLSQVLTAAQDGIRQSPRRMTGPAHSGKHVSRTAIPCPSP